MPTSLVQINSDGTVTVLETNYNKSNFNPSLYPSNNVFPIDSLTTVSTQYGNIETGFIPVDSVRVPFTDNSNYYSSQLASFTQINTVPDVVSTVGEQSVSWIRNETIDTSAKNITTRSGNILPIAEQKIEGTGYGTFIPTELVFQSIITPEVINYLTLSGATATEYNPTIGTIGATGTNGFVGLRAAQFKGSYLDTNTAAAGISLPGFTSSTYFLVSGWVLMETTPSGAYEPILLFRGQDGVSGSTSDSFRLWYDNMNSMFKFSFHTAANTSSTTYPYTIMVSPSGVTLNQWHHFAVAYTNAGNSATASSYWNGNRVDTSAPGITGSLRGTRSSVYIGCGGSGKNPFKGWVDDLVVSVGNTLEALRGFRHGTTATVPSTHQDAGYYTVYYLSMDGPDGTSYFPCDTTNKMASNVAFQGSSLYVYGCIGVTSSRMWTASLNGVCGGHAAAGASAGYIFGYDSGACWIPTSVTEISSGLTAAKQYRKDLNEYTFRYYLGLTMYGASGASGDFKNLYSGSTFPTSFTYTPIESNINYLKTVYDSIVVAGSTLPVSIADSYGIYYNFVTAAAANLYQDVLLYFNRANSGFSSVSNTIDSQSSMLSLKRLTGTTSAAIVSKLAASGNESLFISPLSTVTKTSRSPENYWNISVEQEILNFVD